MYFGTEPNVTENPKVKDGVWAESYSPPGNLDNDTIYYWRVDSRVGATLYEGERWDFTTAIAEPVITTQPRGVTVEAGETAVFTVVAANVTEYSWKKLSDGSEVGTEAALTIDNVQKADESVFYCEVSNATATVTSDKVNLMTRRLVALWKFEDSLDAKDDDDKDAICWPGVYTDPNTANPPPIPVYVLDPCAIDGKAISLDADELHIRITGSEDFFNFYPQGYTVSAWIKTEQSSDWGCFASKQDRPSYYGWVMESDGVYAAESLRQVFEDITGTSTITDNQWHLVTGTYDREVGIGAIYVDGKFENEMGPSSAVAPTNTYPVVFGAETVLGEVAYAGLLDDVRIYSYALSPVEVAVLYTNLAGGEICLENPEYDLNDDCRVNIQDFALFAADWLECNIVPTCLP